MATLILRLDIDPNTKKKNVWVKYDSDSDALPMEHEEQHKKIVEALLAGGAVKAEDLGTITIEREGQGAAKTEEKKDAPTQREAQGSKG
jgi:DNA-binding GntR family transcriptional regulator